MYATHPLRCFLLFFQKNLLLTHPALSSCLFIPETHFGKLWRESVVMVTRHEINVKLFFGIKIRVFTFFFGEKENKHIKHYQKQQNV